MTTMALFALLVGIVAGVLVGFKLLDHSLMIFFHRQFLFGDSYLSLYDRLDHDGNFELMKNQPNPPKSYAEYLRLHEDHRENAVKDFRAINRDVYKYLAIGYGLVLLLAVAFWSNWDWYLFGVFVAFLPQVLYRLFAKGHRAGFYVTLMLLTILSKK